MPHYAGRLCQAHLKLRQPTSAKSKHVKSISVITSCANSMIMKKTHGRMTMSALSHNTVGRTLLESRSWSWFWSFNCYYKSQSKPAKLAAEFTHRAFAATAAQSFEIEYDKCFALVCDWRWRVHRGSEKMFDVFSIGCKLQRRQLTD